VFAGVGEDPVHYGLVRSLASPGGNITGLVTLYADLVAKQLELIKEAVPSVSRVTVVWDAGLEQALAPSFKSLKVAAQALGMQPQLVSVRGPNDFAGVFRAAASARAGALILFPSPTFFVHHVRMASLAAVYRFPAISPFPEFAQAGGFMTYGPNLLKIAGYAARMVDRIL